MALGRDGSSWGTQPNGRSTDGPVGEQPCGEHVARRRGIREPVQWSLEQAEHSHTIEKKRHITVRMNMDDVRRVQ